MTPQEELATLKAKLRKIRPNSVINIARRNSIIKRIEQLMQILGDIDATGKAIRRDARDKQEEIETSLRSMRNKAIVDAITTHYETRERLNEIQSEIIKHIKETGEDLWEKLDRYQ